MSGAFGSAGDSGTQSIRSVDVAGLGNALVDALVQIPDDAVLGELGFPRGRMTPVSHERWHEVYERLQTLGVSVQSGGSCANTMATLGYLGAKVCFAGQVGDDQMGHLYASSIHEACGGHALRFTRGTATGKCLAIISPVDAERTMLTDLGAAIHLPELGEFEAVIRSARVLHTEGYLLLGDPMKTRVHEAVEIARGAGTEVSLDVSDPFVVGVVGQAMWDVIERSDIVFLNADEATALGGSPELALARIGEKVRTVVLKLGARGSLVRHEGRLYPALAWPTRAVDTTGAGDAYAAGYLYGHLQGWDPSRSASLAARVAALAVSQVGAVYKDRAALAIAIAEHAPAVST